jgi:hypothetical protein
MRSCRGLLVAALDAVWKILQRDSDARPMDGMAATASFRRVRRAGAIAAIATACALPFPVRSEFIFPHVSHGPANLLLSWHIPRHHSVFAVFALFFTLSTTPRIDTGTITNIARKRLPLHAHSGSGV